MAFHATRRWPSTLRISQPRRSCMNAWALLSDHGPRFAANVASAASRNSDLTLCGAVKGSRPSSRAARRLPDPMARGLRGVGRSHPPSLRSTRLPYRVLHRLRRPLSAGRPVRRGAVPHHRPATDHPGVLSRSWQISSGTDARCRRECGHGKAMAPDDDPDVTHAISLPLPAAHTPGRLRRHRVNARSSGVTRRRRHVRGRQSERLPKTSGLPAICSATERS